jgi:hypothetical protein
LAADRFLRETVVPCQKRFGLGQRFAAQIFMDHPSAIAINDGSLAMPAAIRRAALPVNNLASDRRPTSSP